MLINKRHGGYINTDKFDTLEIDQRDEGWVVVAYRGDHGKDIDLFDQEEYAQDFLNSLVIFINAR